MYVLKRDGRKESVMFDKITSRIKKLCYRLNMDFIDPPVITMKVINGLYPGVTTAELDSLAAEVAISRMTIHPDYAVLAARIAVSNLQKETKQVFSDVVNDLYFATDEHTGYRTPLISEDIYQIINKHAKELDSAIVYDKDFNYTYFGFKALEKSYLLRINGRVAERPQHMLMRVAVGIHKEDIDAAVEMYRLMSDKWFICSCSTLFHAGLPNTQLSSCFVLTAIEDSVEGIYETLKRSAVISKKVGGVGLSVHNIRAKGTHIAGTGGCSNGLAPMLKLFNDTQCFIDESGNKHMTGCTVYLEPWHADIFEFIGMKKHSDEPHHLHYALWIPDLFMERVKTDGIWSLMCPHESPGLADVWGEEFEILYNKYEKEGKYKSKIRAQDLWIAIIRSQIDTGFPYILYKDSCNLKSNHQHFGTIKCGSLNADVVQYSSPSKVGVCSVASIALEKFVNNGCYDFEMLKKITKLVTFSLNKVIDVTDYPLLEAQEFAKLYRPLGIGVQGLADAFILMKYSFDSEEAQMLNRQIFETIYYAALEASCELAERFGQHEAYKGSPISKGVLQYDMWNITPSNLWDWSVLKQKISQVGLRNSLLISLAPTVHAAEILGNNESTSPVINNVLTKQTYFGTFEAVNTHLLKDLNDRGLWNKHMKDELMKNKGSVQNIDCIPEDIKLLYRTVWELPQKIVLKMTADRGAFVDQSQSVNVYFAEPTYEKMTSMLFYGWNIGLKTGMSSLHTPQLSSYQPSPRKRKPSPREIK